jgi:hypothetical protein
MRARTAATLAVTFIIAFDSFTEKALLLEGSTNLIQWQTDDVAVRPGHAFDEGAGVGLDVDLYLHVAYELEGDFGVGDRLAGRVKDDAAQRTLTLRQRGCGGHQQTQRDCAHDPSATN